MSHKLDNCELLTKERTKRESIKTTKKKMLMAWIIIIVVLIVFWCVAFFIDKIEKTSGKENGNGEN